MYLQIMSDMHYRDQVLVRKDKDADVLVCAGDMGNAIFKYPHEVIFVPGNHEYYGAGYVDNYMAIRYVKGQRFLCATLWTDFMGRPSPLIKYQINDFNYIKGISIELMQEFNAEAIEFLDSHWVPEDIIVTHFPPVVECHNPNFPMDYISDYFNNDIKGIRPKAWISGHTHYSQDFKKHGTRFISSQGKSTIIEVK